jgi:single-strand DNA-binding protein
LRNSTRDSTIRLTWSGKTRALPRAKANCGLDCAASTTAPRVASGDAEDALLAAVADADGDHGGQRDDPASLANLLVGGVQPEVGEGRGPSANHVTVIGRMATTPELRTTSNGRAVTSFRIAVNGRGGDVQFITVVAWRQRAEFVTKWVPKGRLIHIEGRLQSRTWEAQDGSQRQVVEIIADRVQGLSSTPTAATA